MWVRVYNMNTGLLCRKFHIEGMECEQIKRVRQQYNLPDEPTKRCARYVQYETQDYLMEVEL